MVEDVAFMQQLDATCTATDAALDSLEDSLEDSHGNMRGNIQALDLHHCWAVSSITLWGIRRD